MKIPLGCSKETGKVFKSNFDTITRGTGKLMLMAGDQKIEHLNNDFFGLGIAPDDASPEHMFQIADKANIGVFATQLGLISKYGMDYPDIPYLIKINSKTNLIPTSQRDPLSSDLWNMEQVRRFKDNSGLKIMGVGYTIYPGSEFEHIMLAEASNVIFEAHQMGLVAVIWAYPRGRAVKEEKDNHLIAGAAGIAACLGADFVKVNYPESDTGNEPELFKEAVMAAGRTGVICAGGKQTGVEEFLKRLHEQIHVAGASGNATGRNIHQRPFEEAVRMCNAIFAVTVEGATVEKAINIFNADA